MARPTIAQLREVELSRLVAVKTATPADLDYAQARTIMNRYYRLCALSERNFYIANDERTCDTAWAKRSEAKEERLFTRLNQDFKEIYHLELVYTGIAPRIGIRVHPGGGFEEKIHAWFY